MPALLNVVFLASKPLHVILSVFIVEEIQSKGRLASKQSLIVGTRHSGSIEIIKKMFNLSCFEYVHYHKVSGGKSVSKKIKRRYRNLYSKSTIKKTFKNNTPHLLIVFTDYKPYNYEIVDLFYKLGAKVVQVEASLGIYNRKVRTKKRSKFNHYFDKILGVKKCNPGENPMVHAMVVRKPDYLNDKQSQGKIVLDFPTIDLVKGYNIDKYFRYDYTAEFNNRTAKKNCLYLGSPLSEVQLLSKAEEKKYLNNLMFYLNEEGYSLTIKPHPMDTEKKYEVIAEEGGFEINLIKNRYMPAEILPLFISPDVVMCIESSAGIFISIAFNLPVVYLYKIMGLKGIKRLDEELFDGIVIENIYELGTVLRHSSPQKHNNQLNWHSTISQILDLEIVGVKF